MSTLITESNARRAVAALREIYIVGSWTGPSLGLVFDELEGTYIVATFSEGRLDGSALQVFRTDQDFIAWLTEQNDESFTTIASSIAAECAPLTIATIAEAADLYERNATAVIPGPYRVEHPKGGLYTLPPLHFACAKADAELFERAFRASNKELRRKPSYEGRNALASALYSGFTEGARRILELDGVCCSDGRWCTCLCVALETERWDAAGLFTTRIRNQDEFVRAVPPYFSAEKRRKLMDRLGIQRFTRATFLNSIVDDEDSLYFRSRILEELARFPETNLNESDELGWTPFLKILALHEIDEWLLKKLLDHGADPCGKIAGGASALDLVSASRKIPANRKPALALILYQRGARSAHPGIIRKWLRDLRAKYEI